MSHGKVESTEQGIPKALTKRVRGGIKHGSITLMIRQGIESASKHGIKLVPGIRNNADGNCQYESVLNNINHRPCYEQNLKQHPNDYRYKWVTELEVEASKDPDIAAGYSDEIKRENWNLLKRPFVYEVPYFGDFIMHGIARGCKKDILIFNTSPEAWDPIYVITASRFGGQTDSDIPVVLAYNQNHYESLHPFSTEDINKTKDLVHAYINGDYPYTNKDIPYLIDFNKEQRSMFNNSQFQQKFPLLECASSSIKDMANQTCKVNQKDLHTNNNQYDINFPSLQTSNNCKKNIENKVCELSLEEIKLIPVKDRTPAEKKQYNHLMYVKNKEKKNNEVIETDTSNHLCTLTLEELKQIPVKNRTPQETKRYYQLMYQDRKASQVNGTENKRIKIKDLSIEEQKKHKRKLQQARSLKRTLNEEEEMRFLWKENQMNSRKKRRIEDPDGIKKATAQEKACQRQKARENNDVAFKKYRADEKAKGRKNARDINPDAFKKTTSQE